MNYWILMLYSIIEACYSNVLKHSILLRAIWTRNNLKIKLNEISNEVPKLR